MKALHPFPARMAPDLALTSIAEIPEHSVVLDPMAGSGTVLRQASAAGHRAIGFDMDPLAVLMSRVATTRACYKGLADIAESLVERADRLDGRTLQLPWIDDHAETKRFVAYWFAPAQRLPLRKLAMVFLTHLRRNHQIATRQALLLALSRIIITKEPRASLARDTSRSRPHRVQDDNDCDVYDEFIRSAARLEALLESQVVGGRVRAELGDARRLNRVRTKSVDAIVTSPPYLNAIDYLRGHRMSLVWMGYSLADIRAIRSESIGSERAVVEEMESAKRICKEMGEIDALPRRFQLMIERYAGDLHRLMREAARVLKPGARGTFVIGNSCLNGTFILNSAALRVAGELNQLELVSEIERELPSRNRSLPIPDRAHALGKRMRTENVLVFRKKPVRR